jgi:uncharacterized damage-inducible protein DinB/predicted RNase H-like HicB family nuclease
MADFDVYLESNEADFCLAHVPALPGCFSRGRNADSALQRLPGAIRAYYAWLRRHGESPEDTGEIDLRVVETVSGAAPIHPGDAAALFQSDRQPVAHREVEQVYWRRAGYARRDLLALTRSLPADLLEWPGGSDVMSLGAILRHVGNAEQWYVSRLVPPDTLPAQWRHDEEMPLFDFLEMTRHTAVRRLRRLSAAELAQVTYPQQWTRNPDEAWSARKALRRMIEHEREHTAQIAQLLGLWRRRKLARLAAARSDLLQSLLKLDEETLCEHPLPGGYTVKQLLAHIGAWDEFHTRRLVLIRDGRSGEIEPVDVAGYNEELRPEHASWNLQQAVSFFRAARQTYLEKLATVSDQLLHQEWELPGGDRFRLQQVLVWRFEHDVEHQQEIEAWRQREGLKPAVGDRHLLDAFIEAANTEMRILLSLAGSTGRDGRPVCGQWSWKELVGHLADWNWYGLEALGVEGSGRSLSMQFSGPQAIQKWNERHAAARRGQPWARVWYDYMSGYTALRKFLAGLDQKALAQTLKAPAPWDWQGTFYDWIAPWPDHERGHAVELRA